MRFAASIVTGTGKGKHLGFPTLNLALDQIPEFPEGVYCCFVFLDDTDTARPALLHYGRRPTLNTPPSCEVHVLGYDVDQDPQSVTVELGEKLRDVADFGSEEKLKEQLQKDRECACVMLQIPCSRD